MKKIAFIHENGTLITGVIIEREAYYIRVRITSPYRNMENSGAVGGWARRGFPRNFKTEFGEKLAVDLLSELYEKLEKLDNRMDTAVKLYLELEEDRIAIDTLSRPEIKERLYQKAEKWLFDTLFISVSIADKESLLGFIRDYIDTKLKTFVTPDPEKAGPELLNKTRDAHLLDLKIERLEELFKEDRKHLTDENLDIYNQLKKKRKRFDRTPKYP